MTEAHEQVKNGNVVRFLKDYWFIVVFIVGAAIGWSEMKGQILANQVVNETQAAAIVQTQNTHNVLELKYARDITFIKTTLEEFKK